MTEVRDRTQRAARKAGKEGTLRKRKDREML